jgi:hypothetical protein
VTPKKVAVAVFTALAVLLWMVTVDKVWPANSAVPQEVLAARKGCVTINQNPCHTLAKQKARQFRKNKIGRSIEGEFSPKIKRLIRKWYRHHPAAAFKADPSDWWESPFEYSGCVFWKKVGKVNAATQCRNLESQERVLKDWKFIQKETTKITVKCGGAAVIAGAGSKTLWGAGAGGVGCLWLSAFDLWWN